MALTFIRVSPIRVYTFFPKRSLGKEVESGAALVASLQSLIARELIPERLFWMQTPLSHCSFTRSRTGLTSIMGVLSKASRSRTLYRVGLATSATRTR